MEIGVARTFQRALLLFGMLLPQAAAAQPAGTPLLIVGHAGEGQRPMIDGRVDDAVWGQVSPFTSFIQQEPNEGQPATERTEIRFLLDRQQPVRRRHLL